MATRPTGVDTHRRPVLSGETWMAGAFLLPLLALVGLFIVVPVAGTVVTSFYRDADFRPPRAFIGLANYRHLLADPAFWQSVRFTVLFVAVSVPLELAAGLAFALVLNADVPFRGWLRACVLVPWAVPAAVSARTWELIFNYSFGAANAIVTGLGLADAPINWLGTDLGAFVAVVVADAWKTTPFVVIILLAGLQSIPSELYAAARIDGAGLLRRFVHLTVPLLKPVIVAALLFRTIDALRVFDLLYVLTEGGPGGSTTSVSLLATNYYLTSDYGFGSAVSVLLFALAFGLAVLYLRVGRFAREVL
ncbi:MAG: carbohydrate ABC transporter permease [Planctomycetota bacterium]